MVTVNPTQKASISSQAAEALANIPRVPFAGLLAPYLASPRRAKGLRDKMATNMKPIEDDLIARHKLHVTSSTVAEVLVVVITPPIIKSENKDKILLNFYGGGFIMGSARERAALIMSAEMCIRVYSVEYSKSPEVHYPVARNEALAVYRELLEKFSPNNIFGMGSSSGTQILVSMLLVARDEKLPMPARIFLCTPGLDLSGAGDSLVSNEGRDIMPVSLLWHMVKQNYQPEALDVKDPYYSPIYAEYDSTFPPTVITVGTRDFNLSSGVRMYWKLRDAGVETELLVSEGMWHGFNWTETLPEAIRVRQSVREFLLGQK
jgi:monoterpene epsilon-lactone hydrolase